jgi:hypothetical protein
MAKILSVPRVLDDALSQQSNVWAAGIETAYTNPGTLRDRVPTMGEAARGIHLRPSCVIKKHGFQPL